MTRAYTYSWLAGLLFASLGVSSCTSSESSAALEGSAKSDNTAAAGHAAAIAGASGGSAGASGSSASAGSASAAPMKDDGAVTWSNIFTFDFRSCQVSTCHGAGTAGVVMTNKDAAWESLVNVPSAPDRPCAMLNKQRVVPGNPDESLLYIKLDVNAPCGQQMPIGGQLSQKSRDRIKAWIEMGAMKD